MRDTTTTGALPQEDPEESIDVTLKRWTAEEAEELQNALSQKFSELNCQRVLGARNAFRTPRVKGTPSQTRMRSWKGGMVCGLLGPEAHRAGLGGDLGKEELLLDFSG